MSDILSEATATALADHPRVNEPDNQQQPRSSNAKQGKKVRTDHHLWGTYILLVLVAVIELFSASIQEINGREVFQPLLRHGRFIIIGLIAMFVMQKIHFRTIYHLIPFYCVLCFGLMVLVYAIGESSNEATRSFQFAGFKIHPSEFLKLGTALGMAWILSRKACREKDGQSISMRGMLFGLAFLIFSAGLVFFDGLSNALIVSAIGFSTMLISGMSWRKFFAAIGIFALLGGGAFAIKTQFPEKDPEKDARIAKVAELNQTEFAEESGSGRGTVWKARIARHFRPNKHKEKFNIENQQEQLSYIAQANGGIKGVGIGRSRENARLPLAFSDYIFAIIVEEMGLFVGIGILLIYMWILGRSAKLAWSFVHNMPGILVMAAAFTIVFQALYHIAIVTGFFPVSGQPLPLISKGGTCVIATSLAFGVMLSVSRHAIRQSDSISEQRHEAEILPNKARSTAPKVSQ